MLPLLLLLLLLLLPASPRAPTTVAVAAGAEPSLAPFALLLVPPPLIVLIQSHLAGALEAHKGRQQLEVAALHGMGAWSWANGGLLGLWCKLACAEIRLEAHTRRQPLALWYTHCPYAYAKIERV